MRADSVETVTNHQSYSHNRTLNTDNTNQHRRIEENKSNNSQPDSLREKKQYTEQELEEEVKESVKDVNEIVEKIKEGLSFQIHDDTDKLMVQVIDVKTQEVIKELPPEEMLDLEARIHEMVGILIDEKV